MKHALPRDFATTRWSLVLATRPKDGDSAAAHQALAELCRTYWYPLYAFVRFRGHGPEEAQDLTQAFFARLLEKQGLAHAVPERGRFRSYLLGAMKHFLANDWHRQRAQKRGGEVRFVDLDALEPEARYALAPADHDDPDAGFDRQWALAILDRARTQMHTEYADRGHEALFVALEGCLTGEEPNRQEVAQQLDMSDGAVKVAVHRLRKRFGALVRREVAETVQDPGDIDGEMRYLIHILRKK